MERVLTTEERIRRAEEIYRNKGNIRKTKTKEHSKLKNRIIKKVIIQILVCLSIYCIFYSFQKLFAFCSYIYHLFLRYITFRVQFLYLVLMVWLYNRFHSLVKK